MSLDSEATLVFPASASGQTPPVGSPEYAGGVEPGTLLAGRYRVQGLLGRGGTSEVYRAYDLHRGEPVAVKRLMLGRGDPKMLARLRHEQLVAGAIEHPNILKIFDFMVADGAALLTMELLEGLDLRDKVPERAPLPCVLRWLTHASTGLGHLHARGWIHGDVKPANLFLTRQGVLKITDFGLTTAGAGSDRLLPGAITGTPDYMAPEQISGRGSLSPATDLYALGAVAWRLLAGRLPFHSPDIKRLLQMKLERDAPSLRAANPMVPQAMDALVARLLSRDQAARPRNTEELRAELVRLWPLARR